MKRFGFALLIAVLVASVSAGSVISLVPDVTEVEACICDAQPVMFTAEVTEPAYYAFVKSGNDYGDISMPIAPPEWDFPENVKDFTSFVTPSCFISVGDYDLKVTAEGPSTDYFDLLVKVSPCVSLEDLNPSKSMCFGQTKTYQIKLKNKSRTADKNYTIFLSGSASAGVTAPTQVFVPSEGESITEFTVDSTKLSVGEHDLTIRAVAIYAVTGQPTEDEDSLEMVFHVNDCQSLSINFPTSVNGSVDRCFEKSLPVPVEFTNNGPVAESLTLKTDNGEATLSQSSLDVLPGVTKSVTLTLSKEFDADSVKVTAISDLNSMVEKTLYVKSADCYSVGIEMEEEEKSCSDWRGEFPVRITNHGREDDFAVKVKLPFSYLTETDFRLRQGETKEIGLIVAAGFEDGEYNPVITVSSSDAEAEYVGTINFERCYAVRLAAEPYFVCQCQDKAFPVDVMNIGTHDDEYTVGLSSGPEWLLFDNQTLNVPGKGRRTVNPHVFSCDAEPGEYSAIINTISTLQNVSERSAKLGLNFTLLSKADCYTALIEANVGEYVECKSSLVPFNITNTGPVDNSFSLKVEGPKWIAINPEVLTLEPNERGQSYLVISPPLNTVGNEYDVTIRAISKGLATEKKIVLRVVAVGSKPTGEWSADLEYANGSLTLNVPKGASVSVLGPDGNVSALTLEDGYLLWAAAPGEWLVSVDYEGETRTLSYLVKGEVQPRTGLFAASSNLAYFGALALLVILAAAYYKTRK